MDMNLIIGKHFYEILPLLKENKVELVIMEKDTEGISGILKKFIIYSSKYNRHYLVVIAKYKKHRWCFGNTEWGGLSQDNKRCIGLLNSDSDLDELLNFLSKRNARLYNHIKEYYGK